MDWFVDEIKVEVPLPSPSNEDPLDEKPFKKIKLHYYESKPSSDESDEESFNLPILKRLICETQTEDLDWDNNADNLDEAMLGESTFTWEKDFKTFKGTPEKFSGKPGPIKDFETPYDSFIEICDLNFIRTIAKETNRHAKQTIEELKVKETMAPSSRLHQWTPTDANEIMVLFAVFMYMGIDARLYQDEYWETGFLEMPKFKQLMPYARYLLLSKFLHFDAEIMIVENSNEAFTPRLAKLEPLMTYLNNKFSTVYNLDRDISIDKSLTILKADQATNNSSCVVKSYELCESHTGYVYKFQINTGKRTNVAPTGLSKVVIDLLKDLQNRGHCVAMDNYCPALARYLKTLGFDCLGTLRAKRHLPDDIAKVSNEVAKGTIIARHCGDISVTAWKDSKMVTIISTYHSNDTCLKSAGKVLIKPVSVRDYSNAMAGVELKNQNLSNYLLERKKTKQWYIKMFKRLLNVSIHNAFVMYASSLKRRQKRSISHREFRYSLAKSLVDKHYGGLPNISQSVGQLMRLRRDILHIPKYESGRNKRKRCRVCFRQRIDKNVRTQCVSCDVHLCFEKCWSHWHSSEDLVGSEPRSRKKCIKECIR